MENLGLLEKVQFVPIKKGLAYHTLLILTNFEFCWQGQCKENAIVVDEDLETLGEIVSVQGSPLKVLTSPKYRYVYIQTV